MHQVPQQDWLRFEALVGASERQNARSLSLAQRFALYEDMYRLIRARSTLSGNWDRLEEMRWEQKLNIRRKMNRIFAAMDGR